MARAKAVFDMTDEAYLLQERIGILTYNKPVHHVIPALTGELALGLLMAANGDREKASALIKICQAGLQHLVDVGMEVKWPE